MKSGGARFLVHIAGVFFYTETMKTRSHRLPLLAACALLAACSDPETHRTGTASLPEATPAEAALVERFRGEMPGSTATEPTAELEVASVDGHVRFIRESLQRENGSATNIYLYFEDQPVYFQGHFEGNLEGNVEGKSQDISEENVQHLEAFVEFGVEGDVIGAAKRLDGERVPLADAELVSVMGRGLELLEASRSFGPPDFCDYNKTLRWNDVLATVSVPQGENCNEGRLRIFTQVGKRTLALDTRRNGVIADSWIGDFSGNGKPEILVALTQPDPPARGEILAFRAEGDRLQPIEIATLSEEQRAGYGGQDLFRVHGNRLIRRFPRANLDAPGEMPAPHWARLTYDWQGQDWVPAEAPDRGGWPVEMQGRWQLGEDQFMQLEADGGMTGKAGCNRFSGGSLWFPGNIVLIRPLAMTRMACPEASGQATDSSLPGLPGAWFAERVGEELRLTRLDAPQELRLAPVSTTGPAAPESAQ